MSLPDLLNHLSSPDNSLRATAESNLDRDWLSDTSQLQILLEFLSHQAASGDNDSIRSFAAVLFRRIAIKTPKNYNRITDRNLGIISDECLEIIRNHLLSGFTSGQSSPVRHKLSDALAEVAKVYVDSDRSWVDLVPALVEAAGNSDASIRESGFRVFGAAPEIVVSGGGGPGTAAPLDQIIYVFDRGFADPDADVRTAACTAFVAVFRALPRSLWPRLLPLLPNVLNLLPMFLDHGDDLALALVLESLVELVEVAPKMFSPMLEQMVAFGGTVARNQLLEPPARNSALELLTTFAEVAPGMCRRSETYADAMVVVTLGMLTEVCVDDDDASEWNNHSDADEDDEPHHDAARQALDRVALCLGPRALAAPLFLYLPQMCQSDDWRQRQAALMALSSAAEGCAPVLTAEIPRLLDMVLPLVADPHPRVQYAACNALGQMSTDFADVIQRQCADRVMPALAHRLTLECVFRVQAHAAAALVNFCEAAPNHVLEPYLDLVVRRLVALLDSPKNYVQEQVLTTIAVIADAAQHQFVAYYDALMPMLMAVLRAGVDRPGSSPAIIRAKCIECCTLIAAAVGREKFAPQTEEVVRLLAATQADVESRPDDPCRTYLDHAWSRMCRVMGPEFAPCLPLVVPPLLTAARATQDISLLDEDEAEDYGALDDWDVVQLQGRHIAVHTAALDEKVTALDLLRTYSYELGAGFYDPWVPQVVALAVPALDFYLHDGVRASAALTLSALLACCVAARGADSADALGLWAQMCDKLCLAVAHEPVPELLLAYYTALADGVDRVAEVSLVQMGALAQAIGASLGDVYGRIRSRGGNGGSDNDDDYSDADADADAEDDDEFSDSELLDKITMTVTALFRRGGANFVPSFQAAVAPTVVQFVHDDNPDVVVAGLAVVADAVRYAGRATEPWLNDTVAGAVAQAVGSSDPAIRQYAAMVTGAAAEHGGELWVEFCVAAVPLLMQMALAPTARTDENVYATEALAAAIASIAAHLGPALDAHSPNSAHAVVHRWVHLLPICHNHPAATTAYAFLASLIHSNHPAIASNPAHIVDCVLQGLAHAAVIGPDATAIATATRPVLASLPRDDALALVHRYRDSDVVSKYFS